jgi:hypothetical protein
VLDGAREDLHFQRHRNPAAPAEVAGFVVGHGEKSGQADLPLIFFIPLSVLSFLRLLLEILDYLWILYGPHACTWPRILESPKRS